MIACALLGVVLAGAFEKHDAVLIELGPKETLRFRITEVHASSRKARTRPAVFRWVRYF